ncbi:MAG TPA: terminase small subunit [Mucilaginibacter sp.]|jgi:hypothetical protein|nr:terminase small subunit [Mucilaginibacter sp.]
MKYFKSAKKLDEQIGQYFKDITDPPDDKNQVKANKPKTETDFSTIAGLALHLGFSSRQEMEEYELNGKYAERIRRARLRIMADYEKKLHVTSSTGAIFALKSMGWNDRPEPKPIDDATNTKLKVEIVQTGPPLAASENEVIL